MIILAPFQKLSFLNAIRAAPYHEAATVRCLHDGLIRIFVPRWRHLCVLVRAGAGVPLPLLVGVCRSSTGAALLFCFD